MQNYILKKSFKNEDEIKTFSDKGKIREFVISRITLQEMLIKVHQTKRKSRRKAQILRNEWRALEMVNK